MRMSSLREPRRDKHVNTQTNIHTKFINYGVGIVQLIHNIYTPSLCNKHNTLTCFFRLFVFFNGIVFSSVDTNNVTKFSSITLLVNALRYSNTIMYMIASQCAMIGIICYKIIIIYSSYNCIIYFIFKRRRVTTSKVC